MKMLGTNFDNNETEIANNSALTESTANSIHKPQESGIQAASRNIGSEHKGTCKCNDQNGYI